MYLSIHASLEDRLVSLVICLMISSTIYLTIFPCINITQIFIPQRIHVKVQMEFVIDGIDLVNVPHLAGDVNSALFWNTMSLSLTEKCALVGFGIFFVFGIRSWI